MSFQVRLDINRFCITADFEAATTLNVPYVDSGSEEHAQSKKAASSSIVCLRVWTYPTSTLQCRVQMHHLERVHCYRTAHPQMNSQFSDLTPLWEGEEESTTTVRTTTLGGRDFLLLSKSLLQCRSLVKTMRLLAVRLWDPLLITSIINLPLSHPDHPHASNCVLLRCFRPCRLEKLSTVCTCRTDPVHFSWGLLAMRACLVLPMHGDAETERQRRDSAGKDTN